MSRVWLKLVHEENSFVLMFNIVWDGILSDMNQDWDNINHSAQAEGTEEVDLFSILSY